MEFQATELASEMAALLQERDILRKDAVASFWEIALKMTWPRA